MQAQQVAQPTRNTNAAPCRPIDFLEPKLTREEMEREVERHLRETNPLYAAFPHMRNMMPS